jgi:FkbM family methyltransferase
MLITINELKTKFNIQVTGILHIGAHTCEELQSYLQLGVNNNNIYWIEAIQELVDAKIQQNANIKIYQAVISDKDDEEIIFNITRNAHTGDSQSSSMLDFGSHAISHPQVKIVNKRKMKTSRMETVIERNNIDMSIVNFVNLDIQGVELRALKSMEKYLSNIKYIYTEVNTEQVYKDCDQMNDLTNYLKTLGFILTDTRIYKEYGWGDAFYIKN